MLRRLKALIALAGLCLSCATINPVVQKVGHAVDCSAKAVVSQLPSIVAEVATDLLAKDYVKLLTDIGKRVGTDALVCAVKVSADSAEVRMAATPGAQPNAEAIRTNGTEYLRMVDAQFAVAP